MVAGLIPHVGKSFVSLNLAASFGLVGKKVLYIDADMRKAACRYTHEGLTDVLMGRRNFEDVVYRGSGIKDFDILESGTFNMAAFELLRGDMFKNLLEELRPQYDKIIIDTPPISLLADAYMIVPLVDLSLIVLHYGVHSMEAIKEALQNLNRYTDKPKAFVLNHCEHRVGSGYGYGYYGYGRYGRSNSKKSKKESTSKK